MKSLILASTSKYRAQLLSQLGVPFSQQTPDCDETPQKDESVDAMVRRLSAGKARSLVSANPDSLIIGSDQVADREGQIFGKPDSFAAAVEQLSALSGQSVIFHTGLCLLATSTAQSRNAIDAIPAEPEPVRQWLTVNTVTATFRQLRQAEIVRYVERDKPFDCACSFRSEGRGLSLLSSLETGDPSALIGLPLIQLSAMLREAGIQVP